MQIFPILNLNTSKLNLFLFIPVVTLVCGWTRGCYWAEAAPVSPLITATCLRPTTSRFWSWKPGHSADTSTENNLKHHDLVEIWPLIDKLILHCLVTPVNQRKRHCKLWMLNNLPEGKSREWKLYHHNEKKIIFRLVIKMHLDPLHYSKKNIFRWILGQNGGLCPNNIIWAVCVCTGEVDCGSCIVTAALVIAWILLWITFFFCVNLGFNKNKQRPD